MTLTSQRRPITGGTADEETGPAQFHPKIFRDWRGVEIDGIRMDRDAEQIVAVAGRPAKVGSVYFVNRTYERWTWPDGRQVIHVTMDGKTKANVDLIRGYSLAVRGKTLLRKGDTAAEAKALLGNEQLALSWGRGIKIDYRFVLDVEIKDGKVSAFRFDVPVAGPEVPLEGEGRPYRGD